MAQLINQLNFNSFLQCLNSLRPVNIFQLYAKDDDDSNHVQSLKNAKKRIIAIVHMAERAYLPLSSRNAFFSDAELSNVLDNFYIQTGNFQDTKEGVQVIVDKRPNNKWCGIQQFMTFLKWFYDILNYVGNSPVPQIKRLSQGGMSLEAVKQMMTIFNIIHSHYQTNYSKVEAPVAEKTLENVFDYF